MIKTDTDALVRKLRYMGRQYAAGQVSRGGSPRKHYLEEAADTIERLTRENAALKTVMVAAAEEIHAHWQAHCDADGYGPQNLMRRLEEGIPSEYGYTAGAFAELKRERDETVADAARYRWLRARPLDDDEIYIAVDSHKHVGRWGLGGDDPAGCDAAIDAAIRTTKATT